MCRSDKKKKKPAVDQTPPLMAKAEAAVDHLRFTISRSLLHSLYCFRRFERGGGGFGLQHDTGHFISRVRYDRERRRTLRAFRRARGEEVSTSTSSDTNSETGDEEDAWNAHFDALEEDADY
jgi:hypothetical protein